MTDKPSTIQVIVKIDNDPLNVEPARQLALLKDAGVDIELALQVAVARGIDKIYKDFFAKRDGIERRRET